METLIGTLKLDPLTQNKFTRAVLVQESKSEVRMVIFDSKVRDQFNKFKKGQTVEVQGHWENDRYKGGQQFVVDLLPLHEETIQEPVVAGRAAPNHNDATYNDASYATDLGKLLDRLRLEEVWRHPSDEQKNLSPVEGLTRYLDVTVSLQGFEFWSDVLRSVHAKVHDFASTVAYAIFLPEAEGVKVQKPASFMFSLNKFSSFGERDWVEALVKRSEEDAFMTEMRLDLAHMGAIPKAGITPITRQALKRLHGEAERRGHALDGVVKSGVTLENSFKRIVACYGGTVVSRVFDKQSQAVEKMPNLATPYYFERLIHRQYNQQQLRQIKQRELPKPAVAGVPENF